MIDIIICTKDRPVELGFLLESLRIQTFQKFDIYILDDASKNLPQNSYYISFLINRLNLDGHKVNIYRNEKSQGVSFARQLIVDYAIKDGSGDYLCRLDDDVILEPNYLELLMNGIKKGYDLISGVTPPLPMHLSPRSIKFVSPVINKVLLKDGKFVMNMDDCGHTYICDDDTVILTPHFRSCALYKKSVHDKVNYECHLTESGFREEEFFSFRMIIAGFKLGVVPKAIAWHFMSPSGGDRREEKDKKNYENQRLLNVFVKEKFEQHGDFIKKYYDDNNVKITTEDVYKNTNLIIHTNYD